MLLESNTIFNRKIFSEAERLQRLLYACGELNNQRKGESEGLCCQSQPDCSTLRTSMGWSFRSAA